MPIFVKRGVTLGVRRNIRTARVLEVLHHLKDINKLVKTNQGWSAFPVSHPRDHRERKRSDQVSLLGE